MRKEGEKACGRDGEHRCILEKESEETGAHCVGHTREQVRGRAVPDGWAEDRSVPNGHPARAIRMQYGATMPPWPRGRFGASSHPLYGAAGCGRRASGCAEGSSAESWLRPNATKEAVQTRLIAVPGATLSTLQVGTAAAANAAAMNMQITAP